MSYLKHKSLIVPYDGTASWQPATGPSRNGRGEDFKLPAVCCPRGRSERSRGPHACHIHRRASWGSNSSPLESEVPDSQPEEPIIDDPLSVQSGIPPRSTPAADLAAFDDQSMGSYQQRRGRTFFLIKRIY